jgi:uncharacterized protein
MTQSQFRPYSASDALRSDRSAGDRARPRHKVRQAIRENIADIIAEEAIIGRAGDRVVKVPIRGIREYRFVFGDNSPGVGTGQGDSQSGQPVSGDQSGAGKGGGGDEAGVDYYETDITLDELISIMFEDLELPDLERKKLRQIPSERTYRRKGFRKAGVRVHLDKKRTVLSRLRRQVASANAASAQRFPFHRDDMVYRRLKTDTRPQSNAVVVCMMDTSGSMDTVKKYLARSFFFLLYQFVRTRYQNVELVFIAHHARAMEVTEHEFFHKGESGGTVISCAYTKALEVINERYHPSMWNVYAFHCSDGDNFPADNDKAVRAAEELAELCNLFGYGEIKPPGKRIFENSMMEVFKRVTTPCFHMLTIHGKEDVYPGFKSFLRKDQAATAMGAEHA